ncbi:ead/Ea22-like family protein [Escherichia coli]
MESNIKGLVSSGHEMASELKAECGAVDMRSVAKLISDLATQLEVQLVRANELAEDHQKAIESIKQADAAVKLAHEKFSALAAENAGLKHAMAVTLEHVSVTDAGQAGVAAMIINDALHHSETPATDAFLAEVVQALLDERERNLQYIKSRDQENEDIALTVGKLRVELEELKQHAEELSETKAVRNQWRPDICPITGRAFFMWIEHPTLGNVPTYGGPLDSYTIPTKDGDGEFSCERYDHDFGGWVESECLGLYLIDDREQCRVYELEERVKELDAREISLPERSSMLHRTDFHDDYQTVMAYKVSEVIAAIRAAGIRINGGE